MIAKLHGVDNLAEITKNKNFPTALLVSQYVVYDFSAFGKKALVKHIEFLLCLLRDFLTINNHNDSNVLYKYRLATTGIQPGANVRNIVIFHRINNYIHF